MISWWVKPFVYYLLVFIFRLLSIFKNELSFEDYPPPLMQLVRPPRWLFHIKIRS